MLSYQRPERALSPDKTLGTMELEAYKTFLPALFYLASKKKKKPAWELSITFKCKIEALR